MDKIKFKTSFNLEASKSIGKLISLFISSNCSLIFSKIPNSLALFIDGVV